MTDPLAPARGIILALPISLVLWAGIIGTSVYIAGSVLAVPIGSHDESVTMKKAIFPSADKPEISSVPHPKDIQVFESTPNDNLSFTRYEGFGLGCREWTNPLVSHPLSGNREFACVKILNKPFKGKHFPRNLPLRFRVDNHVFRWRLPAVLERENDAADAGIVYMDTGKLEKKVRPKLLLSGRISDFDRTNGCCRGSAGEIQGVEQADRTYRPKSNLPLGKPYDLLRRFGDGLLRGKIFYFTLAGFLLIPLGTLGLYWFFDDPNRQRKWHGLVLAGTLFPLIATLVLYGLFG